ncbi:ABC transporter permease [Nocardia asiatica]|uniref:ABC transporter permease n=1 Tax=Nocardia asiatica TaxID=209252 RepID=UPI000688A634|nr:ABC transporter permease [Nocardia asiatica]
MQIIIDAVVTGLPLILSSMGIYLVFVMRRDFDLTVEASFTLGGATTAVLIAGGMPVPLAMLIAAAVAGLMGALTAALHVTLQIPIILAGLTVSIGFYTLNLRILGSPTVSLAGSNTIFTYTQATAPRASDLLTIALLAPATVTVLAVLAVFLKTDLGLALRSSGTNPLMARSYGVNQTLATVLSLVIANVLVGLSGSVVVQSQGFADINMGNGTLLAGIGAILLGEVIIRRPGPSVLRAILAVLIGTIIYRLIISSALAMGLRASDLKAVTALTLIAVFSTRAAAGALLKQHSIRSYRRSRANLRRLPDKEHSNA